MDMECKHCGGTGTCANGLEEHSCLDCASKSVSFAPIRSKASLESHKGLVCKQCQGSGQFSPTSMANSGFDMKPVLALVIVLYSLYIVLDLALTNNVHLTKVLPFASGLISTIVVWYFSKSHSDQK